METIDTGFGSHFYSKFSPSGEKIYCVAGSPTRPYCVIEVDVETKQVVIIRDTKRHDVDPGYISEPKAITFPTEDNKVAHGYLYLPKVSNSMLIFWLTNSQIIFEDIFYSPEPEHLFQLSYLYLFSSQAQSQQNTILYDNYCWLYHLMHPVNFHCGRKPDYPVGTHDFQQGELTLPSKLYHYDSASGV